MKRLAIISALVFMIIVVSAAPYVFSNFDDSSSSEEFSFLGDNSFERNLSIYRYSNFTSANINITGIGPKACYQESANITNQSGTDGSCSLNYSGSYDFDNELNDGDWSTSFVSGQRYNELTYAVPDCNPVSAIWIVKDKGATRRLAIPEDISGLDELNFKIESTSTGTSAIADWIYVNSTGSEVRLYRYYSQWDFSGYNGYEEGIEWNCVSPSSPLTTTEFPQLSINDTVIWSLFGSYYNGSNAILFTLNDSSYVKNTSFYEGDTLYEYLKIPKRANVESGYISLPKYDITVTSGEYYGGYSGWNKGRHLDYDNVTIPNSADLSYNAELNIGCVSSSTSSSAGCYYYCFNGSDYEYIGNMTNFNSGITVIRDNYTIPTVCIRNINSADHIDFKYTASGVGDSNWAYAGPGYIYFDIAPIVNSLTNADLIINGTDVWDGSSATSDDITIPLNNYLDNCSADTTGYCTVPLEFSSTTGGIQGISSIDIEYTNISISNDFSSILNSLISSGSCDDGILDGNDCILQFDFDWAAFGDLNYSSLDFEYDALVHTELLTPANDTIDDRLHDINFSCSGTDIAQLQNVTINVWNSTGDLYYSDTNDFSGTYNISNFSESFSDKDNYTWNCKVFNNNSEFDWADSNYTFEIESRYPSLEIVIENDTYVGAAYNEYEINTSSEDGLANVTINIYNSSDSLIYNESKDISGFVNLAEFNYTFLYNGTFMISSEVCSNNSNCYSANTTQKKYINYVLVASHITSETPTNNTNSVHGNLSLSGIYLIDWSSVYNYSWKNATYYVWQDDIVFNSTTVSLSGNSTSYNLTTSNLLWAKNYTWNIYGCYGNSTFNNCTWARDYNLSFSVNFNTNKFDDESSSGEVLLDVVFSKIKYFSFSIYSNILTAVMNFIGLRDTDDWTGNGYAVYDESTNGDGTPTTFYIGETLHLISGREDNKLYGYTFDETNFVANSSMVSGATEDFSYDTQPDVFYIDEQLYMIVGRRLSSPRGFNWTGSAWQNDSNIVNGYSGGKPSVFDYEGTTYMISGHDTSNAANFGLRWTGTSWVSNSTIVSGITSYSLGKYPEIFSENGKLYAILGTEDLNGDLNGFVYDGSSWSSETDGFFDGLGGTGSDAAPSYYIYDDTQYIIAGRHWQYFINSWKKEYNTGYPTNANVSVGSEVIWSLSDEFNYTNSPQVTDDFSTQINNAINNGTCDCDGCILDNNICTIPFTFNSTTNGSIQYSEISVSFETPSTVSLSPADNSYLDSNNNILNCSIIGGLALDNATIQIWNNSNISIYTETKNISGATNLTSFNYTFVDDAEYHWNCEVYNSGGFVSSQESNNTLFIDTQSPQIEYANNTNNGSLYSTESVFINISLTEDNIKNITYYLWNVTSKITEITYTNDTLNYTFENLSIGSYFYNVTACDMANNCNSTETINVTISEPFVTIVTPTGEYNTTAIEYNISTIDSAASTCKYWITRGASLEVANTTVTCESSVTGTLYVSSQLTDYVFHFYVNDTLGNENQSNSSFSTSSDAIIVLPPVTAGGGGGSTTIIDENTDWDLTTDAGTDSYSVVLIKDVSRDKLLFLQNNGEQIEQIRLTCEDVQGKMCAYVDFELDSITLATGKDIIKTVSFSMRPSEELTGQEYTFNIIATDEKGGNDLITVKATFSNNPILKTGIKLVSSKQITDTFQFPYILIFGFIYLLLQIFSFKLLKDKIPASKFITFLGSMLIALIIVYFI